MKWTYDLLLCLCGHDVHEHAWPTVNVQTGETLRKMSLGFSSSGVPQEAVMLMEGTSHITDRKMGMVFTVTQFPAPELLNLPVRISSTSKFCVGVGGGAGQNGGAAHGERRGKDG